jgi:hypothetical protein
MKLWLLAVLALAAYLAFWPVPIEPVAWDAPTAPALEGASRLTTASRPSSRGVGVGHRSGGRRDRPAGNVFVGYEDGRIVRFSPDGSAIRAAGRHRRTAARA